MRTDIQARLVLTIGLLFSFLFFFGTYGFSAAGLFQSTDQEENKEPKKWGPFEVHSGIGLSAVFVDSSGSEETYRTHYNYLSGFNLSEFSLDLTSQEQGLSWLDYLKLDGNGFGDAYPYEQATLFFGKRGLYEFKGRYWKQDYFFNMPSFALGAHSDDSARRVWDLGLQLFPHQKVVLDVAYMRNYRYGTHYTSELKYQNLVQLTAPHDSVTQDFRIGASLNLGAFQTSVFQNFRKYDEDSIQEENRLIDEGTLPQIEANLPVSLSVPSTQVTARYDPSSFWSITGKYRYSDGHAEAGRNELTALQLTEGLTLEEVIRANSVSDRPEHLGDVEATFDITENLIFSNIFEVRKFSIDGQYFQEMILGNPDTGSISLPQEATSMFEYETIRNRPELEYFVSGGLSVFGGYQYENRAVERRLERFTGVSGGKEERVAHSGFGGVSWRPYSGARIFAELEDGRADDAFTQTEARRYTRLRFSSVFPVGTGFSISPHLVIANHSNKTAAHDYDADQRQIGVDLNYHHPDSRLDFSAGYSVFDLDSLTDISFYFGGTPVEGLSDYRTQLHFFRARVVAPVGDRLSLKFGYQYLVDPEGNSYPLNRHVGEAGAIVSLGSGWAGEVTWYGVSYDETLRNLQDYNANRLALTLRWGF